MGYLSVFDSDHFISVLLQQLLLLLLVELVRPPLDLGEFLFVRRRWQCNTNGLCQPALFRFRELSGRPICAALFISPFLHRSFFVFKVVIVLWVGLMSLILESVNLSL